MEKVFGKIEAGSCEDAPDFSHPGFTLSELEDIANRMCESECTLYEVVGDVYVEERLLRDLIEAAS